LASGSEWDLASVLGLESGSAPALVWEWVRVSVLVLVLALEWGSDLALESVLVLALEWGSDLALESVLGLALALGLDRASASVWEMRRFALAIREFARASQPLRAPMLDRRQTTPPKSCNGASSFPNEL